MRQKPRIVSRDRLYLGGHVHGFFGGSRLGIELMHMIKKKQMVVEAGDEGLTAAERFYALAA